MLKIAIKLISEPPENTW